MWYPCTRLTLQLFQTRNKISFPCDLVSIFFKAVFSDLLSGNELLGDSYNYLPITIQWLRISTFPLHIWIADKSLSTYKPTFNFSEVFLCSVWLKNQQNFVVNAVAFPNENYI